MIEEANKKLLGVSDLREAIRKRREGRSASGKLTNFELSKLNFPKIMNLSMNVFIKPFDNRSSIDIFSRSNTYVGINLSYLCLNN